MKFAAAVIAVLLLFSFSPSPSHAEDGSSLIRITVKNSILRTNYFEIKDSICSSDLSNECKSAKLFLKSKKCRNPKRAKECAQFRDIADSPECVAGIIFYGWLGSGETLRLEICTDHTGTGRIAARNSPTAPWVHYNWVKDGQTISLK